MNNSKSVFFTVSLYFFIILSIFAGCSSASTQKVYKMKVDNDGVVSIYTLALDSDTASLTISCGGTVNEYVGVYQSESGGEYTVTLTDSVTDSDVPSELSSFRVKTDGATFSILSDAETTVGESGNSDNPNIEGNAADTGEDDSSTGKSDDENDDDKDSPQETDKSDSSTEDPVPDTGDDKPDDGEPDKGDKEDDQKECTHENTVIRNAKEATCVVDGYTGVYCADCGALISKGKVIKATGHKFVNHVCVICGYVNPYGTYTGVKKETDADKDSDVYHTCEYTELTLGYDGTVKVLSRRTEKNVLQMTYTVVDDIYILNYNDASLKTVDNPVANGFTRTEYGFYKSTVEVVKGETITDTLTIALNRENIAVQTEEITAYKEDEEYLNATVSIDGKQVSITKTDGTERSILLDFTNDTFSDIVDTVTVRYYINGAFYGDYIYPDYAKVQNYYTGAESQGIDVWYTDSAMTEKFDASTYDFENSGDGGRVLTLYAAKNYKTVFVFDGAELTCRFGEYGNISSFGDVKNIFFADKNLTVAGGNYTAVWKDGGGNIADTLAVPKSSSELLSDRKYELTLVPDDGFRAVFLVTQGETDATEEAFAKKTEIEACNTLAEFIGKFFGISENAENENSIYEYYNFAYAFTEFGNSAVRADPASIAVSDGGAVTVYRVYCGVSVTYVYGENKVDVVGAGEKYTVNAFGGVSVWYSAADSGIVSYNANEDFTVKGAVVLYAARYDFTVYSEGAFAVKSFCLTKNSDFSINTEACDGYDFKCWRNNGVSVCAESAYNGVFGGFMTAEKIESAVGVIKIDCVFEKITKTAPTENADGSLFVQTYVGGDLTSENKIIPKLDTDSYAYAVTEKATLFCEGKAEYRSEEYGVYEVVLEKPTEYSFTYGGVRYAIKLDGKAYTLTAGTLTYTGTARIENGRLIMAADGIGSSEYKCVSFSSDGSCSVIAADSISEAQNCGLARSATADGKYYGAVASDVEMWKENNVFYLDNIELYNLSDYIEDGGYYCCTYNKAQIKISVRSVDGKYVIFRSKTTMDIPASDGDIIDKVKGTVTVYDVDGTVFELSDGTVSSDGYPDYSCAYDEASGLYILSKESADKAEGYLYYIFDGSDVMVKYVTDGEGNIVEK